MRCALTNAVSLVVLLAAVSARAGTAEDEAAKTLYQAGVERFDARDFAAARRSFEQAYELSHRKQILYNIGVCHREMGEFAQALDYFRRYVAAAGPNDEDVAQVRQQIADLERLLVGKLEVVSRGRPASVTVDGVPRGQTPLAVELPAGAHTILTEGARSERRELVIAAGEHQTIELADAPPPKRRTGLWIGLGVGGAVVVAGVITAAVLATRAPTLHDGTLPPAVVTVK